MTPVEATNTSSGRHPTCLATNSTVALATATPLSPVHALAQPLLHTIARALPPEASRLLRDNTTGAATVLFVVKTAAADAGRSVVSNITSSGHACVGALMPAYTPAALKPAGAVTPPSIIAIRVSEPRAALDMERVIRGVALRRSVEVGDERELIAPPEELARAAIRRQLFRQPGVRNDREPHVHEIRRLMREDTQVVVPGRPGALTKFVHDRSSQTLPAALLADDERPNFGARAAEWRELGARDDRAPAVDADDKSVDVGDELAQLTGQETALLEVLMDELVNPLRIGSNGGPKDRRATSGFFQFATPAPASTSLNAASSNPSARSRSASVIIRGGSNRITLPAVRFTNTP